MGDCSCYAQAEEVMKETMSKPWKSLKVLSQYLVFLRAFSPSFDPVSFVSEDENSDGSVKPEQASSQGISSSKMSSSISIDLSGSCRALRRRCRFGSNLLALNFLGQVHLLISRL